jgi:hypothetical protein
MSKEDQACLPSSELVLTIFPTSQLAYKGKASTSTQTEEKLEGGKVDLP